MANKALKSWSLFIVLVAIALIPGMINLYKFYTPADRWFEVSEVHVPSPVCVGKDFSINVTTVKKGIFAGTWVVELDKSIGDSKYTQVCYNTAKNIYDPSASLPDPVMFSWWVNDKTCVAREPGTHIIVTQWTIEPMNYPDKVVHRSSNEFEVKHCD